MELAQSLAHIHATHGYCAINHTNASMARWLARNRPDEHKAYIQHYLMLMRPAAPIPA